MVFPQEWLAQKAEDDPEGRTNREIQTGVSIFKRSERRAFDHDLALL